jgi:hypothetical protein
MRSHTRPQRTGEIQTPRRFSPRVETGPHTGAPGWQRFSAAGRVRSERNTADGKQSLGAPATWIAACRDHTLEHGDCQRARGARARNDGLAEVRARAWKTVDRAPAAQVNLVARLPSVCRQGRQRWCAERVYPDEPDEKGLSRCTGRMCCLDRQARALEVGCLVSPRQFRRRSAKLQFRGAPLSDPVRLRHARERGAVPRGLS